MKVIYKYPLKVVDAQEVEMPAHAKFLTVQVQNEVPCLWAMVNIDNAVEKRKILMCGTGHQTEGVGTYISTFQLEGGQLVFHVFEPFDIFKNLLGSFA